MVNVGVIDQWVTHVNYYVFSRAEGIQQCGNLWRDFYHIGDIPTDKGTVVIRFNEGDFEQPRLHVRCWRLR